MCYVRNLFVVLGLSTVLICAFGCGCNKDIKVNQPQKIIFQNGNKIKVLELFPQKAGVLVSFEWVKTNARSSLVVWIGYPIPKKDEVWTVKINHWPEIELDKLDRGD